MPFDTDDKREWGISRFWRLKSNRLVRSIGSLARLFSGIDCYWSLLYLSDFAECKNEMKSIEQSLTMSIYECKWDSQHIAFSCFHTRTINYITKDKTRKWRKIYEQMPWIGNYEREYHTWNVVIVDIWAVRFPCINGLVLKFSGRLESSPPPHFPFRALILLTLNTLASCARALALSTQFTYFVNAKCKKKSLTIAKPQNCNLFMRVLKLLVNWPFI